jgi:hypothetical protein
MLGISKRLITLPFQVLKLSPISKDAAINQKDVRKNYTVRRRLQAVDAE